MATKRTVTVKSEQKVKKSFIFGYTAAMAGLYAALLTPVVIGLSLKLIAIDEANATTNLSLVAGIGAFLAMAANPLFGRLSDRTTSRFGMRRPWLIWGSIAGTVGIAIIALASNVTTVLIGWCLAQIAFNGTLAALSAVIADQVPSRQRGVVSGFLGIAQGVGILVGVVMANIFEGNFFWIFLGPGLFGLVLTFIFAFTLKDRILKKSERTPFSFVELIKSFWTNPFKYADFGWAWVGRFSITLALAFVTTYQTFYLLDHVGVKKEDVTQWVTIGTVLTLVIVIVGSIVGGFLSDHAHRRKVFVWVSAAICLGALYLLATGHSIAIYLLGAGILGIAQGAYMAVDLALVTEVLPNKKDTAKDLGVINIANALPQSLAPALAPFLLAINGPNNYSSMFIAAAIIAGIAAVTVFPIRSVR